MIRRYSTGQLPLPANWDAKSHIKRLTTVAVNRKAYNQKSFDSTFGRILPDKPILKNTVRKVGSKLCSSALECCTSSFLRKTLFEYVPILETIRTYNLKKNIVGDVVAGLSVGMVHIPQGMGFALLAAVAPVYGLYATFWQVLIYMLFGSCRHLSIGTMAVISLIIGAVVEREATLWKMNIVQSNNTMNTTTFSAMSLVTTTMEEINMTGSTQAEGLTPEDHFRSSVACGVSLIAGFTMLVMGTFRFGVLTTFMPTSFIGGFTTAAAFHIKATQLKFIFNIPVKRFGGIFNYPRSMIEIFKALPLTNYSDLIISIISLGFLITIKEFVNIRFKKKLPIPIPAEMIVVIVATVTSYLADLNGRFGVKVIGFIPRGIPGPVIPNLERAETFVVDGIVAGVTSFAISISMVDILTKKYKYTVDPNKELVAYGLSYGLSSFFHCFAGAAAPPRCFVMDFSGGKTQIASLITTILMLLVLLVIAPVFRYLSNASLACIIIVALFPLFKQFKALPRLFKVSKPDFVIWITTFLVSTIFDVSVSLGVGILVAILVSVLPALCANGYHLSKTASNDIMVPTKMYRKLEEKSDIAVFRYECTLYYLTIKNFKKQLFKATINPLDVIPKSMETDHSLIKQFTGVIARTATGEKSIKYDKGNDFDGVVVDPDENSCLDLESNINAETPERISLIRVIILDCAPICYIDYMGLNILKELKEDYDGVDVKFVLASCNPSLDQKLKTAGYYDLFEIYPTVQDAVACNTLPEETTVLDWQI